MVSFDYEWIWTSELLYCCYLQMEIWLLCMIVWSSCSFIRWTWHVVDGSRADTTVRPQVVQADGRGHHSLPLRHESRRGSAHTQPVQVCVNFISPNSIPKFYMSIINTVDAVAYIEHDVGQWGSIQVAFNRICDSFVLTDRFVYLVESYYAWILC